MRNRPNAALAGRRLSRPPPRAGMKGRHEDLHRHDDADPPRSLRSEVLGPRCALHAQDPRTQRPPQHPLISQTTKEPPMAKGQKKSNKEVRKPKQPKAKPPEVISVLNPAHKKH
jgi:hypothetical protein